MSNEGKEEKQENTSPFKYRCVGHYEYNIENLGKSLSIGLI